MESFLMHSSFAKHSFLVIAFSAARDRYDFKVLHILDDTDDETRESRDNASDDDKECRRFDDDMADRRNVIVAHRQPSVALCFTSTATRSWNRTVTSNTRIIGSLSQKLFAPSQSPFDSKLSCFTRMKSSTPEKAAPMPIAAFLGLVVHPNSSR